MNTRIIYSKGRVVIPKELRERYNLKKGDKIYFIGNGGVINIVPVSQIQNKIEKAQ